MNSEMRSSMIDRICNHLSTMISLAFQKADHLTVDYMVLNKTSISRAEEGTALSSAALGHDHDTDGSRCRPKSSTGIAREARRTSDDLQWDILPTDTMSRADRNARVGAGVDVQGIAARTQSRSCIDPEGLIKELESRLRHAVHTITMTRYVHQHVRTEKCMVAPVLQELNDSHRLFFKKVHNDLDPSIDRRVTPGNPVWETRTCIEVVAKRLRLPCAHLNLLVDIFAFGNYRTEFLPELEAERCWSRLAMLLHHDTKYTLPSRLLEDASAEDRERLKAAVTKLEKKYFKSINPVSGYYQINEFAALMDLESEVSYAIDVLEHEVKVRATEATLRTYFFCNGRLPEEIYVLLDKARDGFLWTAEDVSLAE